jgi:3-hydroxybutyryl-CoA dehydratase
MSTLSLNRTNRFSINNIKKNMRVTLKKKMNKRYFDLSIKNLNDSAPIHKNDQWARRLGLKKKIFPGFAVTNPFSKLIGMYLPGKDCVIMSVDFKFKKPTFQNDNLVYICKVTKILKSLNVVLLSLLILREKEIIVEGNAQCKILSNLK